MDQTERTPVQSVKSNVIIYVDSPATRVVEQEDFDFVGWIGWCKGESCKIAFRTINTPLRVYIHDRPDVRAAHPDRDVAGFSSRVLLRQHLQSINQGTLIIYAVSGGLVVASFRFLFPSRFFGKCLAHLGSY